MPVLQTRLHMLNLNTINVRESSTIFCRKVHWCVCAHKFDFSILHSPQRKDQHREETPIFNGVGRGWDVKKRKTTKNRGKLIKVYCESQFVIELLSKHFCVRVALRSREE